MQSIRAVVLQALYVLALVVLAGAYVRSAWLVPQRNYPFDFSINYTGARLLVALGRDANIYDRVALAAEAAPYTGYTALYTKLFLTYIQTPLTAVLLVPVARLEMDDARTTVLAVSNVMLLAAAGIMLVALRPTRLLVLSAFLLYATFEPMFDSLRLGQVDALIVLLFSLSFWALRRGNHWLVGLSLAGPAILKVSPVLVIGYFVVRRWWRVVIGAAIGGLFLLGLSVAAAGWHNHRAFVQETLPRLSKGSTFYDNVSLPGAITRAHFGEASWYWEDEVPEWPPALRLSVLALTAAIVLGGYAIARRDAEVGFMLAIAIAVLVAPISWSFYPTWLIPSLLFLVARYQQRRAWGRLALLAALYPLLAVVPAHFSVVSDQVYRYPIKTVVLALYCGLLAWETQSRSATRSVGPAEVPHPAAAGAHP